MAFAIAGFAQNNCGVVAAEKDQACYACGLGGVDFILTITSLVVGILGLTAGLNLPVAASGTFVAIGIAIPVLYLAYFAINGCK